MNPLSIAMQEFNRYRSLGADGLIIEMFRNREAPAITPEQESEIAARLGCSVRQLRAIAKVEGGGSGWDNTGLLKCLWERHWMFRRVQFKVPMLSDPKPGGYTTDIDNDGINDSWQKLARSVVRWGPVAMECASFGKFQIMGGHWETLGYESPVDFVNKLSQSEHAHYDALARFITHNGLTRALCDVSGNPENCRAFARGYNGTGYRRYRYHQKIAAAWKDAKA